MFCLSVLILLTFLLIYISDRDILTINFYENSGDPITGNPGEATKVLEELQKWIYLSSAIYLLIKIFLTSLVFYTALYLSDKIVSFNAVFRIVIRTEFIFLIPALLKVVLFHVVYPDGTLTDWNTFYVLSLLQLAKRATPDWYYLLQSLNLFEVAYWLLLAQGISIISGRNFDNSLKLVLCSYVPVLFVWVLTITFCSLVLFPNMG